MATKGDEELSLRLLELFSQNDSSLGLSPMPNPGTGPPPGVAGMLSGPPMPPSGPPIGPPA